MSSYHRYKQRQLNPAIMNQSTADSRRLPEQFVDYMKAADTRFSEICEIYLECLTIDDIRFMEPEDFINLIPDEQFKHKLLMTIMVRKYLFRDDNDPTRSEVLGTLRDNVDVDVDVDDNDVNDSDSSSERCSCHRHRSRHDKCDCRSD